MARNEPSHDVSPRRGKLVAALDVVARVAFILLCVTMIWVLISGRRIDAPPKPQPASGQAPRPPAVPVSLEGAATRGDKSARVAIVEYSDFQCPFCIAFTRDTLPDLEKTYVDTGKVLLAFQHLPLEGLHPNALMAAQLASCASRQGKFWEMHDLLFTAGGELRKDALLKSAGSIGIDAASLQACADTAETTSSIEKSVQTAHALGVSGTPTFLVGTIQPDGLVKVTTRLAGAKKIADFRAALDKVLAPQ